MKFLRHRRYTKRMDLQFSKLLPDIQTEINKLLQVEGSPKDPKGFSVLEGFFYAPMQDFLGSYTISNQTIVNIAILGNSTKVIYYYPVKALLPERIEEKYASKNEVKRLNDFAEALFLCIGGGARES